MPETTAEEEGMGTDVTGSELTGEPDAGLDEVATGVLGADPETELLVGAAEVLEGDLEGPTEDDDITATDDDVKLAATEPDDGVAEAEGETTGVGKEEMIGVEEGEATGVGEGEIIEEVEGETTRVDEGETAGVDEGVIIEQACTAGARTWKLSTCTTAS